MAALAKNGQLPDQNGEEKRIKEDNRDEYITHQDQAIKVCFYNNDLQTKKFISDIFKC